MVRSDRKRDSWRRDCEERAGGHGVSAQPAERDQLARQHLPFHRAQQRRQRPASCGPPKRPQCWVSSIISITTFVEVDGLTSNSLAWFAKPEELDETGSSGAMNEISRRALLSAAAATGAIAVCARSLRRAAVADPIAPLAYLTPGIDAKFGNRIVKVSNPGQEIPGLGLTWDRVAIHHYSIDQAWNADQSLLALDRGAKPKVFLDGRTYEPVFALPAPGDVRWHPRKSDDMIFVADRAVGLWNVRTNAVSGLRSLSGYREASFGDHKGNPSDNGTRIAVTALRSDGKRVVFGCDLDTGEQYPDIDVSGEAQVGHTTISPTGSHIVVYSRVGQDARSSRRRIFTTNGELLQTWTEYERPGHGDFALDPNGDEVLVGRSKSGPDRWRIIARRLVDGKITVLSPPCSATHVSKRNLRDPAWVFATFKSHDGRPGFAPYDGEVGAVSMDGKQTVRRLAQTHSVLNGYLTEPHACPSPDGQRAIFASNWGDADGPIAAYVAEFQPPA